jgi:hypothetical protein
MKRHIRSYLPSLVRAKVETTFRYGDIGSDCVVKIGKVKFVPGSRGKTPLFATFKLLLE